jgi:ubiquinone/menaquinone biosynthesis C-methylase UbiE
MLNLQVENEAPVVGRQVSPAAIFDTLQRYQQTMALKGAIDLELFTHIAKGVVTPGALALSCHASERGTRILCDFMTILGFLRKTDEGYRLTPESAVFLDKASPAYMGSITGFLSSERTLARFSDVAAIVRRGGPEVSSMQPESDWWVDFAEHMGPMVMMVAQMAANLLAQPGRRVRVLDIAAGHGLFGISVARQNRAAEITALDWKNVLEVAQANAKRMGVADRFHTIAGDVFEVDLGGEYDLVLLPNFLHHFDAPTNIALLKKIRASLRPTGCVGVIDFVPNEDRISPPTAAAFSLVMLAATDRGDTYTFRELQQMFGAAGFGESRMERLEPTPFSLVLASN